MWLINKKLPEITFGQFFMVLKNELVIPHI